MGANYLVDLAAEWYAYRGYFVSSNLTVDGPGSMGKVELDVLAIHPAEDEIVHLEASMDSDAWHKREKRFRAKFRAGKAHAEAIARSMGKKPELRQRALLGYARGARRRSLGGGDLVLMPAFLHEIIEALSQRRLDRQIVPEHFPLLRTLHFVSEYADALFARDRLL